MEKLVIEGGKRLAGNVKVSGSKNAALSILVASLLIKGKTILYNVPRIGDVWTMLDMLRELGVKVSVEKEFVEIDASVIEKYEAPYELVKKMRASFNVLGPVLARCGRARVPLPGGCDIGTRPVDYHLKGLQAMGAEIKMEHGYVEAIAPHLKGTEIYFDFPSVGATCHLATTAAVAEGITYIRNAAEEPEIHDLFNFLNNAGAQIRYIDSREIEIKGVESLKETSYSIMPDRMEAGTFMIAAAITEGDVTIEGIDPQYLKPVIDKLREVGCEVLEFENAVRVIGRKPIKPTNIVTFPHPGFPTDMQQPFTALLTIADGISMVTETVYDSRFKYLSELARMGADVKVEGRTAIVKGVPELTGAPVTITDLRAGAALVIAALAAKGISELSGLENLDRGYEDLEGKLNSLGASIKRIREESKEWVL
ncbi:UDP-N-acetylglucosamine 1-carboxyvinyltransferase [bacterium]|nr:UDP-N-acetylglucosamine 1-carboxyvinyltransferase [bacterium]